MAADADDLYDAAVRFLRSELDGDTLRRLAREEAVPDQLWAEAAAMGWFSLLLDPEDGGLGLELHDAGRLFTAVGEHPFPGPLYEHIVVLPAAVQAARDPVRANLLQIAAGEELLAFADPACDAVEQRRPDPPSVVDGRVHGEVHGVRFGGQAAWLLVAAWRAGSPLVVLLPAGRAGIEVRSVATADLSSRYATVALDGVAATPEDVVVGAGEAGAWLAEVHAGVRLMAACELSGLASRLVTMTLDYAKQRTQFGRPIGSFQAIKHILADMAVDESTLANLCSVLLAEAASGQAGRRAGMVAKAHAAAVSLRIAEQALQVHGGIGFTAEHDLHISYKRVLALHGYYGDDRELCLELGRDLLANGYGERSSQPRTLSG